MTRFICLAATAAVLAVAAPVASYSAVPHCAGREAIVLGSNRPGTAPRGWGKCQPARISIGGANGDIWSIRWTSWGGAVAYGTARKVRFAPSNHPDGIETVDIKAYGIGHCWRGGPRAYLYVATRERERPGAPFGPWFDWYSSSKPPRMTVCGG